MSTKGFLFLALGASALFACMGRVADGTDRTTPPLDCAADEHFFNGECRTACTASAQCSAGTQCMAIDPTSAVCLDDTHCSYLGSDSQCLGTGFSYEYTRFGFEAVPYPSTPPDANPYDTTPYMDPYFEYPYTSPAGYGCEGDAVFVKIPAAGDVACQQPHAVNRCRREGNTCMLFPGTTLDMVSP